MKSYNLFIVAFAVVIASLIKSQMAGAKKEVAKKSNPAIAYWPSEMKKDMSAKLLVPGSQKKSQAVSSNFSTDTASNAASVRSGTQARGIASIGPAGSVVKAASSQPVQRFKARTYYSNGKRGYMSGGFGYGAAALQDGNVAEANSNSLASRNGQLSNSIYSESPNQELASFTRTPDLSINVGVDPEMGESFEDQLRKFREQNQLTAQELQELEVLTNYYHSMAGSVQRGQMPAPQINAEAIKLTRSFINLKRRIERRPQ